MTETVVLLVLSCVALLGIAWTAWDVLDGRHRRGPK
jgi:hypothetical protein